MVTHYETFGIDENASPKEIKKAYRKLVMKHHPDKTSGSSEDFLRVQQAYGILSDNLKKQKYDFELKNQRENLKKKSGLEAKIIVTEAKIVETEAKIVETQAKIRDIKVKFV